MVSFKAVAVAIPNGGRLEKLPAIAACVDVKKSAASAAAFTAAAVSGCSVA
jgi:hypothetical protein